jgi:hypothetical protein
VGQKNGSATGGQTSEYIFTSHLGTATSGANNATLQYLFNTFGSNELITTGSFFRLFSLPSSGAFRAFSDSFPMASSEQLHLHGHASVAQVFLQRRLVEMEELYVRKCSSPLSSFAPIVGWI